MLMAVIILAIVVVCLVFILLKQTTNKTDSSSAILIKKDLDKLSGDILNLKDNINNQISERLDRNQSVMNSSLQRQFSESAKLISEVTKNLTELKESNKQVVSITDELKTLQNVLQNPKQRGVLGEYYLQTVLENVLPPERFKLQYVIGKDLVGSI